MQQCDSKRKRTKKLDWAKVEENIRELWEQGLSPRAISLKLKEDGRGTYPPPNINSFVGKFRRTESMELRKKNLGGLSRAPQVFDSTFVCAICELVGERTIWNSRFCMTCRSEFSDRQLNRFKVYGIKPHDFEKLIENQNNRCELCDIEFDHSNNTAGLKNPCVDHCHLTGIVRGILCVKCNWALHMAETPGWMDRVREYLK